MDNRKNLIERGLTTLTIGGRVFRIDREKPVGRGGSCLVYYAFEEVPGEVGRVHRVILKEFCPVAESDRERKLRLKHFKRSYENFLYFHNHPETNQYTVDADCLVEENNSWYQIVDYNEGVSLKEYMADCSLYQLIQVLINVAHALSKFHILKYLHLDVTPGNILVYPENQTVRIMDTDTIVQKKQVLGNDFQTPFSSGYGAPELLELSDDKGGIRQRVQFAHDGERADVFAMGAILYHFLYGVALHYNVLEGFTYEEALRHYVLKKYPACSRRGVLEIQEFLRRTLAKKPKERFASMQQVEQALRKILPFVEEGKVHIRDNFLPNNSIIYGREEKLRELEYCFQKQGSMGSNRISFISGTGGIGKSALAKEYAKKHMDQYDLIVEVSAISAKQALLSMELVWEENAGQQDLEERTERLLQLLDDRNLLLIVHDYNVSEDSYFAYFRKLPCDILLTTWNRWTAISGVNLSREDLAQENQKENVLSLFAQYYLRKVSLYGDAAQEKALRDILEAEKQETYELIQRMDFHPLTIKVQAMQMSYVMGQELKPSQMLQLLQEKGIEKQEQVKVQHLRDEEKLLIGDAYYHLEFVFRTALERGLLLKKEKEVLRLMLLMTTSYGVGMNRFSEWTGLEKEDTEDALQQLWEQGWLEYEEEGRDYLGEEDKTYRMPMSVSQVLYRQAELACSVENCRAIFRRYEKTNLDDLSYLPMQQVLEHGWNMVHYVKEEETEAFAGFLHVYSLRLFSRGEGRASMELAVKYVEKSLIIRRNVWGEDAEQLTCGYCNLGVFYTELCEWEKAISYQRKAIRLCEDCYGRDHEETLKAKNNLAALYSNQGRFKEAIDLYKELPEREKDYTARYNLGLCYAQSGDRKKGLKLMEEALEIAQQQKDQEKVVRIMSNVAMYYMQMGAMERSYEYLQEALALSEKIYGTNHREVAGICSTLGTWWLYQQDFEKGILFLERTEQIYEKNLTSDHYLRIVNLANLGMAYFDWGEKEKGFQYELQAFELAQEYLKDKIEYNSMLDNNLARMYCERGEKRKAKLHLERVLAQAENLAEDLGLRRVYSNAGYILCMLEEPKEALVYLEKGIALEERASLGGNLALLYSNAAYAWRQLGKEENAKIYEEKIRQLQNQ